MWFDLSKEEVFKELDYFLENIYENYISVNAGGMKSPDCFSLYLCLIYFDNNISS